MTLMRNESYQHQEPEIVLESRPNEISVRTYSSFS